VQRDLLCAAEPDDLRRELLQICRQFRQARFRRGGFQRFANFIAGLVGFLFRGLRLRQQFRKQPGLLTFRDMRLIFRPIDVQNRRVRVSCAEQPAEHLQAVFRDNAVNALRRQPVAAILLRRRHADLRPRPPVDAQRRQTAFVPIIRARGQEFVRRCVIALPEVAHQRGSRREQHETIKRQVRRRKVQIPRSHDFRRQHLLEFCPRLFDDCAVIQHARRVENAFQRRHRRGNRVDDARDIGSECQIARQDAHGRALFFKRRKEIADFRRRFAPSGQHDLPRAQARRVRQ